MHLLNGNAHKLPADIRERLVQLERVVVGVREDVVGEVIRHVRLGCSRCNWDDARILLAPLQLPVAEQELVLEMVDAAYVRSDAGRRELQALYGGEVLPPLIHPDGFPLMLCRDRSITGHRSGYGLNEHVRVDAVETPRDNGAPHHYTIAAGGYRTALLLHNPALPEVTRTPINGVSLASLLAVVSDHLTCLQGNPTRACAENQEALAGLTRALKALQAKEIREAAAAVPAADSVVPG